ncbi:MAG: AIPR family protein [Spirochaetes bacterium]|nr:AIPR family protein [Spirochaetota bacterium]
MIDINTIALFHNELENRQIELYDECTTNNEERESFVRACSEILYESGMLIDEPEIVLIDEYGYRVDAICWPENDQPIVEFLLFIKGNKPEEEIKSEITNAFEKTIAILHSLCIPTKRVVPTSVESLIRRIQNLIPCPESILVRVITDSSITIPNLQKKFRTRLKNKLPEDIHTDFRFCGIEDLCLSSEGAAQGPTIEFDGNIVKCFLVHEMDDHDVYLAAFPAISLAKSFREHGQRLLQKNVRAFLGLRGKKNKKIQETILTQPQRFLAYNNGLTITVSNILLSPQNDLNRIEDTQIVNGGQTIAVLANEYNVNISECLSSVMVTAKIIHVKHQEKHMDWIERIAETSNTQNAIKEADLSSHNPLYRKIKELSTQAVFRKGTEQYKWYFSRVRKEYDAELAQNKKRGHIERKKFEETYPKIFSIEKGIVARVECIFAQKPWISSRGETKCQVDFLENIPEGFVPDLDWYRKLIGKVILVKSITKLARSMGIGEGRSCIVEYACAILSWSTNFPEYLERIHMGQEVPLMIDEKMKILLEKVHSFFIALGTDRSIKEHAKRENTWKLVVQKAETEEWLNA